MKKRIIYFTAELSEIREFLNSKGLSHEFKEKINEVWLDHSDIIIYGGDIRETLRSAPLISWPLRNRLATEEENRKIYNSLKRKFGVSRDTLREHYAKRS